MMATIDHTTPLWFLMVGMFLIGLGVGSSMQNLVLVVQNSVALREVGSASGAVTFFRSLGGTIGVSVLGAVLANQVATNIAHSLTRLGISGNGGNAGGDLDVKSLPGPIQEIVRAAYGDATGHIFLISVAIAAVGIIAAVALKPVVLRDALDLPDEKQVDGVDDTPEVAASGGR
jgi:hypothetical protein